MRTMPAPPRPSRPTRAARLAPPRRVPWGWAELVVLAQWLLPGIVFLPGIIGPVRTSTRVMSFVVALAAWMVIWLAGRPAVGRPFPAVAWLTVCMAWLGISVFHPETNSLFAGTAELGMSLAVAAPAFWIAGTRMTTRRLGRLLLLFFAVCTLSAVLGIAQFYRPGRFDPPYIPVMEVKSEMAAGMFFETDDGRRVMRPCGLSDSPGGACIPGAFAFLVGLGLAVHPRWSPLRRGTALGLAGAGLAVLYFSQVRQLLLMAVGTALLMPLLFALRRDYQRALSIVVLGCLVIVGSVLYALRAGGLAVFVRLIALFEYEDAFSAYYKNRGLWVEEALTDTLLRYPLGAGLGRWGMIHEYFGTPMPYGVPGGMIWCEVQVAGWIVSGGLVLMVAYTGALVVALWNSLRIVQTSPDPVLASWGVIVLSLGILVLGLCMGSTPFMSIIGQLFWLLTAALHAADQNARAERRRARLAAAAAAGPVGVLTR